MKIDDQVATANSFPYRYNANTKTIVVGEKYDSSTGEWIVDEEFDNLGDKYKLYILRDLAKEDPSSVGEVTYEWKYALLDEKSNSELITITPDKIQPNTSVLVGLEPATYADYINPTTNKPFVSQAVFDEVYPKMHSKLGKKLEIQVRDNLQAYQFVCNIRNAIETNAGDQDTLSEAYTFCFK